jgi:hypothetical protein
MDVGDDTLIRGQITSQRTAVIEARVIGSAGAEATVEAAIDAGFTEYLTLRVANRNCGGGRSRNLRLDGSVIYERDGNCIPG